MDGPSDAIDALRPPDAFCLPSREAALAAARAGVASGGPVLVTGAAGVGKTWLLRLLARDPSRTWACVDLAPGMTPADLLGELASALGSSGAPRSYGSARRAVTESLRLAHDDGRPVAVILDEAHLASDELLEEARLLANRLPEPLAGLVLCGQTPLARRLDTRAWSGLESRLAARVHLMPLDADEAAALLDRRGWSLGDDRDEVEILHRDSGGVPARLLRLAALHAPHARPVPAPRVAVPAPAARVASEASILPTKPPLREEDGLIEVGWDAPESSATDDAAPLPRMMTSVTSPVSSDPQPIDDHYAALQAWDEWSRNQGRATVAPPPLSPAEDEDAIEDPESLADSDPWASAAQGFEPYNQLVSRLRSIAE